MSEQTFYFSWGKRIVRNGEVMDIHYQRDERNERGTENDHRTDCPDVSTAGVHPGDTATESAPEPAEPWWSGLNPTSVRRSF